MKYGLYLVVLSVLLASTSCTKCTNSSRIQMKACNSSGELRSFFGSTDSSAFCVHEVMDGSKNILTGSPIDESVSKGLKIAFKIDSVSWMDAMKACQNLPGGGWKAPESNGYPTTVTESDNGKSLQALAKYLAGAGEGLFWSGSTNLLGEHQAWALNLGPGTTHYAMEKYLTRYDGLNFAVICVN